MEDIHDTPGTRLRKARIAAGYSNAVEFAQRIGISPVTYRAYENDQNTFARRAAALAERLNTTADWLLAGRGPAPERSASDAPPTNASVLRFEGAGERRMSNDLPIFGTALGAARLVEGEAVEQTTLNSGEVIQYVRRPVILDGRADAYGLYVQGHSMEPVHMAGDLVLAEAKRPARIGDDVIVYLRPEEAIEDDGERARGVLLKRLVRRTAAYIELQQFNPALTFRVPAEQVVRIDRVPRMADLIA